MTATAAVAEWLRHCHIGHDRVAQTEMGLSLKTIDGYRNSLFNRFKVKNRVGLVLYAIKNEIISLSALA